MSQSDDKTPVSDQGPPRLSGKERLLVVLYVGGAGLLIALAVSLGVLAGWAVTETTRGMVTGGLVGLCIGMLVVQRGFLAESWIECGCFQLILWLGVLASLKR